MDPLLLVLVVAALSCLFCWVASLITKDTSWVDRIWSVVPHFSTYGTQSGRTGLTVAGG